MTRGVQNLRISDSPASPSPIVNKEEFQKTAWAETTAQRVPSLCTVRSRSRRSHGIHRWRSHAAHGEKHGGQVLLAECNFCWSDNPLRELRVGDTFQDRRQQFPQSSQPVPPGEPLDSPLPNCPIRDVVLTDRDKHLLGELRLASAMALPRCVVSRYATAWAESFEGAMSGHQCWALLCVVTVFACSLPKSRKVSSGTRS